MQMDVLSGWTRCTEWTPRNTGVLVMPKPLFRPDDHVHRSTFQSHCNLCVEEAPPRDTRVDVGIAKYNFHE